MANIEVNGRTIEAESGTMLIEATDAAGIYIPRFCYHEKLSVAANCRMCLVEVERAPKPMPACATPVTDGMKVFTRSKLAREAQQGTLEFLLINHPLDCPVCDQGGECPLQDQAMGYGSDDSRYHERKRVVPSRDIGPLVATEMTRCIHCTRCVRFGEEVAGAMELGFPGRGESAHIATFLDRTVDSEVSGNMIDLCPVGALTSKPYRFAARSWELENHRGISPHDCVGANLNIQTLRDRVERVLPAPNPQVNDCWLADRDRYSYEAVNSEQRLTVPMIKAGGQWREVAWEAALQRACDGLKQAVGNGGGGALGVLAGYTSTLEEYYLLQKLARALGCGNIDHRVQQRDFRDDAATAMAATAVAAAAFPASEVPIAGFDHLRAALLVGSNIRKEQPLLALRLRAATRPLDPAAERARISSINPLAYRQNFAVEPAIVAGAELAAALAAVAAGVAKITDGALPDEIGEWVDASAARATHAAHAAEFAPAIAESLLEAGADGAVILGALAQQHEEASVLKAIARWICRAAGSRLVILPPGNSAAAWRAGCLPHRDAHGAALSEPGLDAAAMLNNPRRAYLLLGTDPVLDGIDGKAAGDALKGAGFVAQITAYRDDAALEYADVLLPMAAFAESAGAFINCEGRLQRAEAAATPRGESRPAWKILRVLGNFLDLPGFEYVTLDQVTEDASPKPAEGAGAEAGTEAEAEAEAGAEVSAATSPWQIPAPRAGGEGGDGKGGKGNIRRLLDLPMYRGDSIVRNAPALQKTADNPPPAARMNQAMIDRLDLSAGDEVLLRNRDGSARLPLVADARVPPDCVYAPAGYAQTARLGGQGKVTVKKAG